MGTILVQSLPRTHVVSIERKHTEAPVALTSAVPPLAPNVTGIYSPGSQLTNNTSDEPEAFCKEPLAFIRCVSYLILLSALNKLDVFLKWTRNWYVGCD